MTKEQVYDEKINPLVTQVIAICQQHKIANVMSFSLEPDGDMLCTTCMVGDEFDPPDVFKECISTLFGD